MSRNKITNSAAAVLAVICFLVGFAGGLFGGYMRADDDTESDSIVSGSLSVHFPELGSKHTGDCTYIKAGDVDILIDAGARKASIAEITDYIDRYVTDGKLEYVIVTHAHEDHYAGFAVNESTDSIFDLYDIGTIIDFPITNQTEDSTLYKNYQRELDEAVERGAVHYTAAQCIRTGKDVFDLGNGIELKILDSFFYYNKTSGENNYSVCTMITKGSEKYLFTGDLEKDGEEKLVEMNELSHVTLYKAGHHGSSTSSSDTLLSAITPEYVCVCCCAGSSEYSDSPKSQYPTQVFCDRIAKYTENVYVTTLCLDYENNKFTSFNGDIVLTSDADGIRIDCSGSSLPLYKSDWFKENRDCPDEWKKSSDRKAA